MEIINPDTLPGNNARGCNTDALAPNHKCYRSGGACTTQCFDDPGVCISNAKPED